MELKKLAPWNWFKKEEEIEHTVPVKQSRSQPYPDYRSDPMFRLHRDLDLLFDRFFQGVGAPISSAWPSLPTFAGSGLIKPSVDLSATEQEYLLTVEIPGVSEKEISLNISGNTMMIKGEKKQEKEEKEKNYYRMERSYGTFQRVLSLPEDVNQEGIKAGFKDGVLSVTMPRIPLAKGEVKQVPIRTDH